MAMSKKDFAMLAKIVRDTCPDETDSQDNWKSNLARKLADFCAEQSLYFFRTQFLEACGVSDENL